MATTLINGHTYRAALDVNGFASAFATESAVHDAFASSGFANVKVYKNKPSGWSQPDGHEWYVEGDWARPTVTVTKVSDKATFYGIQDMTPEKRDDSDPPKVDPPKAEPPTPPPFTEKKKIPRGPITHGQARSILTAQWNANTHGVPFTLPAVQIAQSIGLMEGGYGDAFERANNWGALQRAANADGSCPVGTYQGSDTNGNTGKKYTACLLMYPTPEAGAAAFLSLLTKTPEEQKALASGNIDAMARAMLRARYMTTTVQPTPDEAKELAAGKYPQSLEDRRTKAYATWIETGMRKMTKALGEPMQAMRANSVPDEDVSTGKVIVAGASLVLGAIAVRALNNRSR